MNFQFSRKKEKNAFRNNHSDPRVGIRNTSTALGRVQPAGVRCRFNFLNFNVERRPAGPTDAMTHSAGRRRNWYRPNKILNVDDLVWSLESVKLQALAL